jgi:hypothetical protein
MGQILECLDPNSDKQSGTKLYRPGESGAVKDQESLEPKKTSRVWNKKRPGESGRKKTRRVCRRKRPGELGTGREQTRKVWNRKREN